MNNYTTLIAILKRKIVTFSKKVCKGCSKLTAKFILQMLFEALEYQKVHLSKIAQDMNNALSRMKKEPEKYKEILEEYRQIYAQYGRRKLKKLQKEKQELLSLTKALKQDVYDSEQLYIETQYEVSRMIDKKIQMPEGPGEV